MRAPHRQLPPTDDSVVLPKSVRDQMVRAAEMQAAATPVEEVPPAAEAVPPVVTPPVAEVVPPVVPPVTPPTPVPPVTTDQTPNYEHMYNSLKGRYDKQELELRNMSTRMDEMSRLMATMTVVPDTPAPSKRSKEKLVTEKDATEYGAEFIDVARRIARDVINEELDPIDQRLDQFGRQVQTVSQVTTLSAQDKMLQQMDAAVPNWRLQNNDENFKAWLALPDAYSGAIRQTMLTQAYNRNEASRVIAFFKGFLDAEAATAPQATEPAVTPEGNKTTLADLAAPGRARTAAPATPPGPAEKPIISRSEITKFYGDVAAGRFKGREAEQQTMENQIFEASNEGRIR